jgi:hypothetical protein
MFPLPPRRLRRGETLCHNKVKQQMPPKAHAEENQNFSEPENAASTSCNSKKA